MSTLSIFDDFSPLLYFQDKLAQLAAKSVRSVFHEKLYIALQDNFVQWNAVQLTKDLFLSY